jgi:hypothetical protein
VRARLQFNAAGELVNFTSTDRGDVGSDGTIRMMPWSTPVTSYADLGGQRLMHYGEAIWSRPDGDFAYAKFTVTGFETR